MKAIERKKVITNISNIYSENPKIFDKNLLENLTTRVYTSEKDEFNKKEFNFNESEDNSLNIPIPIEAPTMGKTNTFTANELKILKTKDNSPKYNLKIKYFPDFVASGIVENILNEKLKN